MRIPDPLAHLADTQPDSAPDRPAPVDLLVVRVFFVSLAALLAGYMFLGRGFAHVGIPPLYVGEIVLVLGLIATAFAVIRLRLRIRPSRLEWLLLAFMAWGAVRTIPYLSEYGLDALRDATLWGYALFALMISILANRALAVRAIGLYALAIPFFALWLPISWNLFAAASTGIDPTKPGSVVPLVFFKGGDMAVHTVGVIAFLVIGASAARSARTLLWRALLGLPLVWTVFVAGTSNRGALVTTVLGVAAIAILAPRSRNWLPILAATAVLAVALAFQGTLSELSGPAPSNSAAHTHSAEPTLSASGSSSIPSSGALAPSLSPSSQGAVSPTRVPTAETGNTSTSGPQDADALAVANAGFELGRLEDGTIEGWTTRWGSTWAPDGTGSYNIVRGDAYRGARFASVRNVLKAYQATLTSSKIPFEAGQDIAVSAWVKAIVARPILEIYVNWYDSSGTLIKSVFLNARATDGVRTWQECAGALTAPADTTQAQVLFYEASGGGATIGIDEVTVRSGDFIPEPVPPKGRPATLQQMVENLFSIFGSSSDGGLEGSKQFRLAWWGTIVDYTVFGDYFLGGKGFGVNLADADGFQATVDHSLRSPHNSTMTVLARMGVPGLLLWLLVQGAFAIGLLRATLAHRRLGNWQLAAVGGVLLVYWFAMMVDTSFDPYLEGPQGGIWFWTIFGLGLVVMRIGRLRSAAP